MKVAYKDEWKINSVDAQSFKVPFRGDYGFFIEKDGKKEDIALSKEDGAYRGSAKGLCFSLWYDIKETYIKINILIENKEDSDSEYSIGFHMGIDSYMDKYPNWHKPFFPTLLRCEKTHLWGYYMNTAKNALAVATEAPAASYDILYNVLPDKSFGHRICGTDILFFKDVPLPERHPKTQKKLKGGAKYLNTIYLIPVEKEEDILNKLSSIAHIPLISAEKYTLEKGDRIAFSVISDSKYQKELILPDGKTAADADITAADFGIYKLNIRTENQKECQALFCCRKDWDFYLENAAKEAIAKPQKASTHVEGFYGLFSCFLSEKYFKNDYVYKKALECFEEIMPLMFDFSSYSPIVIPERIQNTALLISLLTDIYEANPRENLKYLYAAAGFADFLMNTQDEEGVFRKAGKVHYTCVVYIAKALLELALAEKDCGEAALKEKYSVHYSSVKKAVDELARDLDNIDTEGESTLEDGMISCSALQIGMFALTLPENEREKYIKAAEYMLSIHSCLEQHLIPDCRTNGASLRYWESQYDVMVMANMLNSPHGWTAWTAYAHYYLYMLTGKKKYLLSLMNTLGSCVQLMTFDGKLRWSFCAQPYVKAPSYVPDYEKEVLDGYKFVELKEKAYRGKLETREYGEEYIDMISGWYRTGSQKLTGGYSFCPLILDGEILDVDNQGGCCDNDVHEIFKCVEETVLRKAFIYENEDSSLLTYGCKAEKSDGKLIITPNENVTFISYNLKNAYPSNLGGGQLSGFGAINLK